MKKKSKPLVANISEERISQLSNDLGENIATVWLLPKRRQMTLQIETITTKDGRKMDVIRDIEKVRKLIEENTRLRKEMKTKRN